MIDIQHDTFDEDGNLIDSRVVTEQLAERSPESVIEELEQRIADLEAKLAQQEADHVDAV